MKKWMFVLCAILMLLMLAGCSCKHDETVIINTKDPSCEEAGYTGDTKCMKCEEIVAQGTEIAPVGHTPSERLYAEEGTCQTPGYTGDIYCTRCQTVLEQGESTGLGEHVPGESSETEPTCEERGWYSKVVCAVCGETLREEQGLPALGHDIIDPIGYIAPTCNREGFEGEGICANCNEYVTGDQIERLEHTFGDDNICTGCQWPRAGLYDEDFRMIMTWEELVEQELVGRTYGGSMDINFVHESLTGTLVIEEGYEIYLKYDMNVNGNMPLNVSAIYTPCTQDHFYDEALAFMPSLKEVRIYGQPTSFPWMLFTGCEGLETIVLPDTLQDLGYKTFAGCTSLESINIPESVTEIGENCFHGCSGLKEITTPASLQVFGSEAFRDCTGLEKVVLNGQLTNVGANIFTNCTALKEVVISGTFGGLGENMFFGCTALESIELPEGLTTVFQNAFRDTAIRELVFPATMKTLPSVANMGAVEVIDLSKCVKLTTVPNVYACQALAELYLPINATVMEGDKLLSGLKALKRLVLPDTLTAVNSKCRAATVEELVWPVSLQDGSNLKEMTALTSILYRGTEEQWNATVSRDLFPNATITFNYTGD